MLDLLIAATFFVGTHIGISGSQLRDNLIERFGETMYRALYSLVSIVALVWMVLAWSWAPYQPLWYYGPVLSHLPLLVMPLALLLLVAGLSTPNPTAIGQGPDQDASDPARGILRVTRHPVMWAVGLWALVHLLANADLAALIFFGSFMLLALAGSASLDARKTREHGPGWGVFVQTTSFVPFAAIIEGRQRLVWSEIGWRRLGVALALYLALMLAHPLFAGVPAF